MEESRAEAACTRALGLAWVVADYFRAQSADRKKIT